MALILESKLTFAISIGMAGGFPQGASCMQNYQKCDKHKPHWR